MKRQHFSLHYLSGGASGRPKVVEALAESSFVAFVSDDTPTIYIIYVMVLYMTYNLTGQMR